MPKIYDLMPFYNEFDLMEIRLNHLYDHVDYFVICEAGETFTGSRKKNSSISTEKDSADFSIRSSIYQLINFPMKSTSEKESFSRNSIF